MGCLLSGVYGRLTRLYRLDRLLHGLYGLDRLIDVHMWRHRFVRANVVEGLLTNHLGDGASATRPDVHHGEGDAYDTDEHQDPADCLDIDAVEAEVRCESQNRADGDEGEACSDSHFKPSVQTVVREAGRRSSYPMGGKYAWHSPHVRATRRCHSS
jgi:hypothetical protein